MTSEAFEHARALSSLIYDLQFQIKTVQAHKGFCGGKSGTLESPETTESVRVMLVADLQKSLAKAQADFEKL